jgi:hypothetical protein
LVEHVEQETVTLRGGSELEGAAKPLTAIEGDTRIRASVESRFGRMCALKGEVCSKVRIS